MTDTIQCVCCRQRIRKTRGLCINCYRQALEACNAGRITWAELEAAGKALPPADRSKIAWFGDIRR